MKKTGLLLTALWLLMAVTTAGANTIEQTWFFSINSGPVGTNTDSDSSFPIDGNKAESYTFIEFNTGLGTLSNVNWVLDASLTSSVNLLTVDTNRNGFVWSWAAGEVSATLTSLPSLNFSTAVFFPVANVNDNINDVSNTNINANYPGLFFDVIPANLSDFLISGGIYVGLNLFTELEILNSEIGDYSEASVVSDFSGSLKLTYEYTSNASEPVPEPATLLIFGLGLLSLVGISRKKYYSGN